MRSWWFKYWVWKPSKILWCLGARNNKWWYTWKCYYS